MNQFFDRHVLMRPHESFFDELKTLRFWVVFAGLLALTYWIGHKRPVEVASLAMWDAIEMGSTPLPEFDRNSELALISPEDYASMFRGESPLDSDAVAQLLATALHRGAEKVVVDLDTNAEKFVTLQRRIAFLLHCLAQDCSDGKRFAFLRERDAVALALEKRNAEPYRALSNLDKELEQVRDRVIWARGAKVVPAKGEHESPTFRPQRVLGQEEPMAKSAIVLLQADTDGRLRRLRPKFELEAGGVLPAAAVLASSRQLDPENFQEEEIRPRLLAYLGRIHSTLASAFLTETTPLLNKTVFLGGNYSMADSFYMADGREHWGVEVIAAASRALAEPEEAGIVSEIGWRAEWTIKILLAFLVAFVHHYVRPLAALLLMALVLISFALAAATVGLAIGFILNLAGLMLGLGVEQSVEGALSAEHRLQHAVAAASQEGIHTQHV